MKNTRAVVMIVVAVLIGLAAVVLASRLLQQASMATTPVVVANRDIILGTRLSREDLQVVEWPKSAVPAGAFNKPDDLVNAKTPEGKTEPRVLKISLSKGEPVLESKLAPVGAEGGLASVIPEGMRAITVRVNEIVGVAGFAQPGSRVDIMVHTQDENNKPISKIVMENVKILALAQETSGDPNKPKVVSAATLEVTPGQAEKIDLARSVGTLSLVLRNEMDKAVVETKGAEKSGLLGAPSVAPAAPSMVQPEAPQVQAPPPRPARRAPPKESAEVIKGVQKSTVEF
jgi:pilus assembly protein CpaB